MVSVTIEGLEHELRPSKIVCLLRTYAAHAKELSNAVPERPRFFLKPPSALLGNGGTVRCPPNVRELHHEVELSVIIGKRGANIPQGSAMEHVKAYTVMLDMTARDLQDEAKAKGLPWTEAKGYDTFAPVGPEAVLAKKYDWRGKRIWLKVNGEVRQDGNTSLMLFPLERIISDISRVMTLEEGDIIMTGTPSGVGRLCPGDLVEAGVEGISPMRVDIA